MQADDLVISYASKFDCEPSWQRVIETYLNYNTMLLSKIYTRNKEKLSQLAGGSSQNDPRVITPTNIPIFILPTRLDEIHHQPNLANFRDSYEETSLAENAETQTANLNISKSFSNQLHIVGHSARPCNRRLSGLTSPSGSKYSSRSSTYKKASLQVHESKFSASMQNLKATASKASTKTIIKTLFRNGLINMAPDHVNDERKFKENYCDLWVLHGDADSLKAGSSQSQSKRSSFAHGLHDSTEKHYLSKSVSILTSRQNEENALKSRTEEKLQRDYLKNLSRQLEVEEHSRSAAVSRQNSNDVNSFQPSSGSSRFQGSKRESRFKSDMFLSIDSIANQTLVSSIKDSVAPRKLSAVIQKHGLETLKNMRRNDNNNVSSNNLLDPHRTVEHRRFSFRNYFFKQKATESDEFPSCYANRQNLLAPGQILTSTLSLSQPQESNKFSINPSLKSNLPKSNATNMSLSSLSNDSKCKLINTRMDSRSKQGRRATSDPNCNRIAPQNKSADGHEIRHQIVRNLKMQDTTTQLRNYYDAAYEETVNDLSDSDISDFDKVFNDFYDHSRSIRKGASCQTSITTLSKTYRQSEAKEKKTKESSHVLVQGYRSIVSRMRKSKGRSGNRREMSSHLTSEDPSSSWTTRSNYEKSLNKIDRDFEKRLSTHEDSKHNRNDLFKRLYENEKLSYNFKVSQACSVGSGNPDIFGQFKRINDPQTGSKSNRIDYSDPANFDLASLNLTMVERAFKKNSLLSKNSQCVYIKLNRSLMNRLGGPDNNTLNHEQEATSSIFSMRSHDNFIKSASNFLGLTSPKAQIFATVDVSIERVAQHFDTHVLSMSLQNLKVEPLFEINHIKSKLTYLTVQLIDSDSMAEESHNPSSSNIWIESSTPSCSTASPAKSLSIDKQSPSKRSKLPILQKKLKFYAKISRNKTQKCKFNANNRGFQKPVDFVLTEDHFFKTTDEAAISQMQKKFRSSCGLNNENELFRSERSESPETDNPYLAEISKSLTQSTALQKHYIFLFSIELHSYLPISRKTLVSTFRKKKRVFKGQCQIYENFIRTTQFSKRFELYEV